MKGDVEFDRSDLPWTALLDPLNDGVAMVGQQYEWEISDLMFDVWYHVESDALLFSESCGAIPGPSGVHPLFASDHYGYFSYSSAARPPVP